MSCNTCLILRILVIGYVLDQTTKWMAHAWLRPLAEPVEVIPGFFNLVYVTNTGAAFGMFQDGNLFFVFLSVGALIFLGLFFWLRWYADKWSFLGAALILPGVAGNLTDRLVHGKVIDFADFYIGDWHWPAFNVADSCICIGAGLLIISAFTQTRQDMQRAKAEEREESEPPR